MKIGCLLLLLFVVCVPSYSVDIEEQDWEQVAQYVLKSEKTLPQLSQTLETVNLKLEQSQTDLMNCQNKVNQLQISLESMELKVENLNKKNSRLQFVAGIGLTIGIVGVLSSVLMIILK